MMNFDLNNKTDRVLAAALTCFKQYGFKRTSMADIAKSADMSRPALYILFKNKPDIFMSLSERFHGFTLEKARIALDTNSDISTRLTAAILARIKPLYALAHDSLHGPELFDVTMSMAADINTTANKSFLSLLETAIESAIQNKDIHTKINQLNAQDLTQILSSAAFGLKDTANNLESYEILLTKMVKTLFLGLTPK